jgi:hypothetical protein
MCAGVIRTRQHEKTINGVDILLLDLSVCFFLISTRVTFQSSYYS